jgi:hypothetical protein
VKYEILATERKEGVKERKEGIKETFNRWDVALF